MLGVGLTAPSGRRQMEALLLQVVVRCLSLDHYFATSLIVASVITGMQTSLLNLPLRRCHTPCTTFLRLAYPPSHLLKLVMFTLKVAVLRLLPIIRRASSSVIPVL